MTAVLVAVHHQAGHEADAVFHVRPVAGVADYKDMVYCVADAEIPGNQNDSGAQAVLGVVAKMIGHSANVVADQNPVVIGCQVQNEVIGKSRQEGVRPVSGTLSKRRSCPPTGKRSCMVL